MAPSDRPLVVCIGEILWDCFPDRKVLGGAPLNCAYMAQAAGARSLAVSRIGDDADGRAILDVLKQKELDGSAIQIDARHPTGIVDVKLSPKGEPTFTIVENVAYDHLDWDESLRGPLAECRALCFGSLAQRNPAARAAILRMLDAAPQALKVYDINLRQHFYSREVLAEGFRRSQVVKLNDGEFETLTELFAPDFKDGIDGFMARYGIDLLAVTRGAGGCSLYRPGEEVRVPGLQVKVQDTVGSGDAFTAALILARLRGASLQETAREANALGAYVATRTGGTPEIDRPALDALRARSGL
jgi:fructokinase